MLERARRDATLKILSWNVNGRVDEACSRQLDCVLAVAPDVLALQEVTLASYPAWCAGLVQASYSVVSSIYLVNLPYPEVHPPISRRYFNLTATRGQIATLPGLTFTDPEEARLAFPEKYLAAHVVVDGAAVDVHNAHLSPGSTRGVIKIHAFRAIRQRVDQPTSVPRILCGDFNTPQAEDEEGVTTWASARPEELRDEWDAAERSVLVHPAMRDVYGELQVAGEPYAASHVTRGVPRRYDHIYASEELAVQRCRYLTDWLDEGLSDHAAVEADLVLGG
jgi:exodeoxyribonuclease III